MKNFLKYLAAALTLVLIICVAGMTVFAEPESETASDISETVAEPTTEEIASESYPPSEPTESTAEETQSSSEASDPTEETTEPTQAPTQVSTQTPTPGPSDPEQPSYDVDDLPPVEENEFIVPTSIVENARPQTATVAVGIISWICVAVGIIVIITILGSSKTGNYMNGGKQRYESGDIISGGKRR